MFSPACSLAPFTTFMRHILNSSKRSEALFKKLSCVGVLLSSSCHSLPEVTWIFLLWTPAVPKTMCNFITLHLNFRSHWRSNVSVFVEPLNQNHQYLMTWEWDFNSLGSSFIQCSPQSYVSYNSAIKGNSVATIAGNEGLRLTNHKSLINCL